MRKFKFLSTLILLISMCVCVYATHSPPVEKKKHQHPVCQTESTYSADFNVMPEIGLDYLYAEASQNVYIIHYRKGIPFAYDVKRNVRPGHYRYLDGAPYGLEWIRML